MKARRRTLSIGYSLLGAGIGLAGASNMLDDLPPGLITVCLTLIGIGGVVIVIGRSIPRINSPGTGPDVPAEPG